MVNGHFKLALKASMDIELHLSLSLASMLAEVIEFLDLPAVELCIRAWMCSGTRPWRYSIQQCRADSFATDGLARSNQIATQQARCPTGSIAPARGTDDPHTFKPIM